MDNNPQEILDSLGALEDEDIDLGLVAIALAALDQPGISMERYIHHLKILADDVQSAYLEIVQEGMVESVEIKLEALKSVISEQHSYIGDNQNYDDLENTSLIRVIERMKGIPVTLSILYICAGRAQGWDVAGLNMPGHFVCRIDHEGQRLIFDPFHDCRVLEAPDLRMLAKQALGEDAELLPQFYEPCSNRDILIRLQNNIKHRQIEDERYEDALKTVQRMMTIDSNEYRLLFDAGILFAKVEQTGAAIDALEAYILKAPKAQVYEGETREAELLLAELHGRLN